MFVIASDYDRTISSELDGFKIKDKVKERINQFSKRFPFIVVTGRERKFISRLALGLNPSLWVLENGAVFLRGNQVIYNVSNDWFSIRNQIVNYLKNKGISFTVGEVIIYVDNAIDQGLERVENGRIEWNRSDAMILPENIDKGNGLLKALEIFKIKGKIIAVGDSQNDIPLFRVANYKVAVRNALEEIKAISDHVLTKENGEGIIELLDMIESGTINFTFDYI
ncbi:MULTISPECIES: phosphoglycolate phosphatase [Acidianus]|uniref:Phosphoglycolate phosphatase n=1 Tax=Candidatus Acidianus copahuensis TaxID=1160895 RepID=A0A031LI80_9CREN|nr:MULTISPECIES: phosphoglycolate phosphatase [Acidianus]EZQ01822.1 phosphoglycolate phosphatase [Candidatus Acidianus copahuensis]NON61781.1 phosphoglycolate phosphatase [Acidianus sp. RZ1]